MHIGLLVYGLDRPLTGVGRYTVELIRALADLRPPHEITLLTAGGLGPLAGAVPFRAVELPGCRLLPFLITRGNLHLRHLAHELQLDVLHALAGLPPFLLVPPRTALVVTLYDVFAWSIPGYSALLDTLIHYYWLPYVLPRVHSIVTISEQSRSDIARYLSVPLQRIEHIPLGVSPTIQGVPRERASTYVATQYDLHQPYVFFLGTLTERKNLRRTLTAFARVARDYPAVQLVIAGTRLWRATPLEELIATLGIAQHVRVLGHVPDRDLPALYSAAAAFVFPSLYEGFGLPVIEAMACGTPVITSNVSSLPEVAGDAALLVDPYNEEEIAAALLTLLRDPATAAQLRERGLARAATYTWERTARATLATYEQTYAALHPAVAAPTATTDKANV